MMNALERMNTEQKTRVHISILNDNELLRQIEDAGIVFNESSKEMIKRIKRRCQNEF